MQNLSCENEFLLAYKQNSFSQERFCTWPRVLRVRAFGTRKWPIGFTSVFLCFVTIVFLGSTSLVNVTGP